MWENSPEPFSPYLETFVARLCTLYFAGAQASGANVYMTGRTLHNRLYTLYVRLPCSVRASVGVRNLDTEGNTLSANFTFSHPTAPPYTSLYVQLHTATDKPTYLFYQIS
jgi:hypothetical protein